MRIWVRRLTICPYMFLLKSSYTKSKQVCDWTFTYRCKRPGVAHLCPPLHWYCLNGDDSRMFIQFWDWCCLPRKDLHLGHQYKILLGLITAKIQFARAQMKLGISVRREEILVFRWSVWIFLFGFSCAPDLFLFDNLINILFKAIDSVGLHDFKLRFRKDSVKVGECKVEQETKKLNFKRNNTTFLSRLWHALHDIGCQC